MYIAASNQIEHDILIKLGPRNKILHLIELGPLCAMLCIFLRPHTAIGEAHLNLKRLNLNYSFKD